MNTHTAKTLATYAAAKMKQWAVTLSDGSIQTIWASSKQQAIALAVQNHLAKTGHRAHASHYYRM